MAAVGQAGNEPVEQEAHVVVGERCQGEGGEAALPGTPVRTTVEEVGAGQGDDVDRMAARPCQQLLDEVEEAVIRPLEVLEDHDHRRDVGDALEEGSPGHGKLASLLRLNVADPEQVKEWLFERGALVGIGHELGQARGQQLAGGRLIGCVVGADPHAHHLAERPEADAVAVGGRAALVPVHDFGDAVDVLQELPCQPALADAALADDGDEPRPAVAGGGVVEVLDELELAVATDERRLQALAAAHPAALRHDAQRPEGGHGCRLALELLLPGLLEDDCRRRLRGGCRRRPGPSPAARPTGGARRC